jgi:hypothetical protein
VAHIRPKPPVSNRFVFWLRFIPPSQSLRCNIARWKKFLPKSSNVAEEKNKVAGKICGRILPKVAEKWQKKMFNKLLSFSKYFL